MSAVRQKLVGLLPGIPCLALLSSLTTRNRASIFMLHRFRDDERGVAGHDPLQLRSVLAYLRRKRYELVGLHDVFRRLSGDGPPLSRSVAFTIDDGYYDHARIAGPAFAEFDCPVTTFVVTGFLDRQLWLWWDRIDYVFKSTKRLRLDLGQSPQSVTYDCADEISRLRARDACIETCKQLADADKHLLIERLATAAEVALPAHAPPQYEPMSWDDLRQCEARGMTFGPHTVTHPILSRAGDDQARYEIAESWRRLQQEARKPDPVFCYPNGGWTDFGDREIGAARSAGLAGAVVGVAGYASVRAFRRTERDPFVVRRFSYGDDLPGLVQCTAGIERIKSRLRGETEEGK